ncbi:hypothetical protein BW14_02330 [Bifidobacterium sp. UTBIF-68]|uniref:phage major capsid protein n=1 Tax=Bifidobacterium sp. UTBIF-68 TaxID=1465262 RepID=UPI0011272325|nr:phage major capsid protein [Bifidobacterium sp. UTBIF-68]TPF94326.1 hypothetical protein BW14_02330 [Bifidobacterium sp. UTBIF-68]
MAFTITSQNKGAFPDVQRFAPEDIIPEALIISTSSIGANVEGDAPSVRVPFVSEDPEADIVKEGEQISEADPELTELTVNTHKLSVLHRISREAYSHDGVGELLTNSLGRAVIKKADAIYLANKPAEGEAGPIGLVNTTGIVDGGNIDTNLDTLTDAIATVQTNGAEPTHIIASPTAWAYIQKMKAGNGYNTPLIGSPAEATALRLAGLPVVINKNTPAGTLLLIDQSQILSAVGQLEVAVSDQRYFDSDNYAIRLTFRFGFGVLRPDRLAKITVGAAASGKSAKA